MPRHLLLASALAALTFAACTSPGTEGTTSPPPPATPDESATPGPPIVALEEFGEFERPVAVRTFSGDDAWYVVELTGKIWRFDGTDRTLVVDRSDDVSSEGEQGLFDIVMSPDGEHVYIHFTGTDGPSGNNHVVEYPWDGSGRVSGEPREVVTVEQPYMHHNGGKLEFGPDGMLYIGIGDGGTESNTQEPDNGDPHGNGQGTDELLGNILRIDPQPDGDRPYSIPADNPFVGEPGRDEIWAYGLRNPWRFSFDRQTGDLWIADVGHRFIEEINFEPAGSGGGRNYGWSALEGNLEYKGNPPGDHVLPVYQYPHRGGPCAIIGGYVYRGDAIAELAGSYVFGDFCTGQLQALTVSDGRVVSHRHLGVDVPALASLAEDGDGELYAMGINGQVFRIVPLNR